MRTQKKIIQISILLFFGIALCCSPGLAFQASGEEPMQVSKRFFTCSKQGPAMNKTIKVMVSYENTNGWLKPAKVQAEDQTDPHNRLIVDSTESLHVYLEEIDPKNPEKPRIRAGKSTRTGPPHGSIICTEKNYPVYVWNNYAWFVKEQRIGD